MGPAYPAAGRKWAKGFLEEEMSELSPNGQRLTRQTGWNAQVEGTACAKAWRRGRMSVCWTDQLQGLVWLDSRRGTRALRAVGDPEGRQQGKGKVRFDGWLLGKSHQQGRIGQTGNSV